MAETKTEASGASSPSPRYYIKVLGKAIEIISVMGRAVAGARLSDIANACHLDLATALRILHTLQRHGWLSRDARSKKFELLIGYRQYRVGYAQLCAGLPFSDAVTRGLVEAAQKAFVELLVLDNQYDASKAIENANRMIDARVDFAIECQRHARIAPALAEMFAKARIPTLAIDIPQPGALYFGANNYSTGRTVGEASGHFVLREWRGRLNQVLLLEAFAAGPSPHARFTGFVEGLHNTVKARGGLRIVRRDGKGNEGGAYSAAKRFLRQVKPREHVLIAAVNDISALGALRAVRELGRERYTAIIGHDLSPAPQVKAEIKDIDSPFIATICLSPENYGKKIIPIVLRWLKNEQVPPTTYTEQALVVRENVNDFL